MSTSTVGLFLRHLALSEEVSRLKSVSDHDLLAAHESGRGQAAFAELMRRHGPMVLRTCRRILGRGPDAEDAFQATFILLARKATQLRRGAAGRQLLGGWLHRVAYRTALDVLIKSARRRVHERRVSAMTHVDLDPSTEATWNEVRPILDAELDALPEKARQLLIACYLQGKTHAEVAAELGLRPGSLAWHMERARALLATRLARRGVTLSVGILTALLGDSTNGAGVPAVLLVYTLEAVMKFNEKITGAVSARVASLVKGGLANMTSSSTKLSIVLACCLVLGGTALVTCQALSARLDESGKASAVDARVPGQPGSGGGAAGRLDRLGDPLPSGALARLGTTRLRHLSYDVCTVAFSSDGKTLASVGKNETARWWKAATGKEIRTLPPVWVEHQGYKYYKAQISSAAFTLDGKTVAMGENGVVRLWDAVTGKEIRTLMGPKNAKGLTVAASSVAFSPDGKTVASVWGLEPSKKPLVIVIVSLWDVATGKEIHRLRHNEEVRSVAFAPDSKTLAVGGINGTVHLWEAFTGKEMHTLQGPKGFVVSVAFAADGKILASAERNGPVCLWDAHTGKKIRTLQGHEGENVVAFSPDGKTLASAGYDGVVCLWEATTGKQIRTLQGHRELVNEGQYVTSVTFSPDGKTLATGAKDGVVRLWEADTGKTIAMSRGHEGLCIRVAFAPDGKTVASGGRDGTVRLWEAATGNEIRTLQGDKGQMLKWAVTSVAFSPDGEILTTGARDGTVRLWEAATGKEIRVLQTHKEPKGEVDSVSAVAFAPDGRTLASGEFGGTVRLWEVAAGKEIRTLRANTGQVQPAGVWSVGFSPDGKTLAAGEGNGTIRLWQVATAKETRTLQVKRENENQQPITSVAFSPDGRIVASGENNGVVRLWGVSSGKEIRSLQGPKDIRDWWSGVLEVGVAFSHDGRTLAITSGDCVQLWDLLGGTALTPLVGHRAPVHGVAFSPNSRMLASVSADSTGLIWDLTCSATRAGTKPDPDMLKALWTDLASKDAARASQAVWTLVATPAQSVPLLRDRLRPVPADLGKRLGRLIADLDSNDYQVRLKAYQELEKLGPDAEPALCKGLEGRPSVELRKRLKQLLEAVGEENRRGFSGEVLRGLRAVEVLEQIGTPEARQVLKTLADGAPGFLTQDAQAALRRLGKARRP